MSPGSFNFEVVEGWGRGPEGREMGGVVPGVAVDSQDRVYVARRSPPAILVYDDQGRFLQSWGEDALASPHLLWIGSDDQVYCADSGNHTVRKFSADGEVLQTLGTPDRPGPPDTPFNQPTRAMLSQSGDLFVADGYGQFRVHRLSPDGQVLSSWGEGGQGPGQFALPHSLWVDDRRSRVLVMDRENNRIQIFDFEGVYMGEWTDVEMPMDMYIDLDDVVYVSEAPSRISIFSPDGELLSRWGEDGSAPGQFEDAPHGIWVDSRGDLYVAEVATIHNRIQKFARV